MQEVLIWITNMLKEVGEDPTDERVREFVETTLKSGVSYECNNKSPIIFYRNIWKSRWIKLLLFKADSVEHTVKFQK